MATLTPTELARLRRTTGADSANDYSDFELQFQYDAATADAPDSASILPYTYVYVLRDLWGIRSTSVDRFTDHGDREVRSQVRDATKQLLDYWEKRTGLSGGLSGGLQSGTISLGLDEPETTYGE